MTPAEFLENVVFEPFFAIEWTSLGLVAMGITEVGGTLVTGMAEAFGQDVPYTPGDCMREWWKTTRKKWSDVFTWD